MFGREQIEVFPHVAAVVVQRKLPLAGPALPDSPLVHALPRHHQRVLQHHAVALHAGTRQQPRASLQYTATVDKVDR